MERLFWEPGSLKLLEWFFSDLTLNLREISRYNLFNLDQIGWEVVLKKDNFSKKNMLLLPKRIGKHLKFDYQLMQLNKFCLINIECCFTFWKPVFHFCFFIFIKLMSEFSVSSFKVGNVVIYFYKSDLQVCNGFFM